MHYMVSMVQKTEIVNDEGSEKRSSIGARLKEERERLGFSQPAFAAIGGASKGSQLAWEKGTATPNAEFLHDVAGVGVDVLYVLLGEHSGESLAPDESMLLHGWRRLDKRARAGVLALMGGLEEPAPTTKTRASGHAQVINGGSNNVQIGSVKTGRRKTDKSK
ncbi:helix-turn-helix domain-containing protein [Ralstonia nicotianae]